MNKVSVLGWLFFLLIFFCTLLADPARPPDPVSAWMDREGLTVPFLVVNGVVIAGSLVVVVVVGRQNDRAARRNRDLRRALAEMERANLEARRAAQARRCRCCGGPLTTPPSERST